MFRLWFLGEVRWFRGLLEALEHRKALLGAGVRPECVTVEQNDGDEWVVYDVDRFLAGLAVLLAPAD